jgi:hypothetical protein
MSLQTDVLCFTGVARKVTLHETQVIALMQGHGSCASVRQPKAGYGKYNECRQVWLSARISSALSAES